MKAFLPTLLSLSALIGVKCIQEMAVPIDFDGDQVANLQVVDSSSSFHRSLQNNPNCDVSSETTCIVTSENNVRCENFFVTQETCRTIDIAMKYVMCNLEEQRTVELLQKKTIALSFQQEIDISKEPLASGQCRTENFSRKVDTCTTKKIVGSLKVEGHSDPSKIGFYCYAYSYYSVQVFRPSQPSTPLTSSTTKKITRAPTSAPTRKVTNRPTA
jgi:hypothetical protein